MSLSRNLGQNEYIFSHPGIHGKSSHENRCVICFGRRVCKNTLLSNIADTWLKRNSENNVCLSFW